MPTTQKCPEDSLYLVLNNVVNLKLTEHGRIYKIFHVKDIENLLEIDNLEEYINNVSF